MNVQKLKLMACNKEALVIRINVCFSKTKSALFFLYYGKCWGHFVFFWWGRQTVVDLSCLPVTFPAFFYKGIKLSRLKHIRQKSFHWNIVECTAEKYLFYALCRQLSQGRQHQKQSSETYLLTRIGLIIVFSQHALCLVLKLFHMVWCS